MVKLSILIPSYNRSVHLKKNCSAVLKYIFDCSLEGDVRLVVSNNCSSDDTFEYLTDLAKNHPSSVDVVNQSDNIGSVNNVLFLLGYANAEYVLFLGDDDYLHPEYLSVVMDKIRHSDVGVIIPSNIGVSEEGEYIGFSRDIDLPNSNMNKGFKACLEHSWRGHQLSGLVFKREGLHDACVKYDIKNMYLFIFLVALSAFNGSVIHITQYPVSVTRPSQASKGWSYGDDGLIFDIFDNYKKLPGISYLQRVLLELKILDDQYWRYAMYLKLGLSRFVKALKNIITGSNTSLMTGITFPMLLPFIVIKRIIILCVKGDLMKTLKRSVDI
jgi:glycosyltransferase involved in cell wall biosynthesis